MKYLKTIIIIALILVSNSFLASAAVNQRVTPKIFDRPLIPTGYGEAKFLYKDFYLGCFLIDTSAVYRTPEDLLFIDAARRMEFKFITEKRMSGRAFIQQLLQSMKINNDPDALRANIANLKLFKGFFRRSIKKGDILRFDYHKRFGTRVYLNKRLIGEISDSNEFYRFILNTWLGDRPPSAKFKRGILGQNGDGYAIELQKRFDAL
ncbi:MAG: chalcone isomerase family protein [Enterobacterales bacterium]|nr:chalcone isomerase family protein [Enterobacterales bacterium]